MTRRVGSDQRCCQTPYNVQDSPRDKELTSPVSLVLRLRNAALTYHPIHCSYTDDIMFTLLQIQEFSATYNGRVGTEKSSKWWGYFPQIRQIDYMHVSTLTPKLH